jgi:hypothetical protein
MLLFANTYGLVGNLASFEEPFSPLLRDRQMRILADEPGIAKIGALNASS